MPNKNFSSEGVPARQSGGDFHRTQIIQWTALAVYAVLVSVGLANHEMWRDEALHWLIAVRSKSFSEIIALLRYHGHPPLWHFLLFLLYKVYPSYIGMQILHGAIAVLIAYLILFWTRFTLLQRALIIFGYLFSYEYAVISRNCNMVVLFSILLMLLYPNRKKNIFLFCLCLIGNVFSSVYGLIISCGFVLMNFYEHVIRIWRAKKFSIHSSEAIIYSLIFTGMMGFLWTMYPLKDFYYFHSRDGIWFGGMSIRSFLRALSEIWSGYVPLPAVNLHFWWENIINHQYLTRYFPNAFVKTLTSASNFLGMDDISILPKCFLSILLVIIFWRAFSENKSLWILFMGTTFGLLLFQFGIYNSGQIRHTGFFFIVLLICLHLAEVYSFEINAWVKKIFFVLLVSQVIGAGIAYYFDVCKSFSSAKNCVEYLKKEIRQPADDKIVTNYPPFAASFAVYLGKDVYAYPMEASVSYIIWNSRLMFIEPEPDDLLRYAMRFLKDPSKRRVWILSSSELPNDLNGFGENENLLNDYRWRFVNYFGPSVSYEDFYLYELERTK